MSWNSGPCLADVPVPARLCVRCATALATGDQDHDCVERNPHPVAFVRGWRCECLCGATGTAPVRPER